MLSTHQELGQRGKLSALTSIAKSRFKGLRRPAAVRALPPHMQQVMRHLGVALATALGQTVAKAVEGVEAEAEAGLAQAAAAAQEAAAAAVAAANAAAAASEAAAEDAAGALGSVAAAVTQVVGAVVGEGPTADGPGGEDGLASSVPMDVDSSAVPQAAGASPQGPAQGAGIASGASSPAGGSPRSRPALAREGDGAAAGATAGVTPSRVGTRAMAHSRVTSVLTPRRLSQTQNEGEGAPAGPAGAALGMGLADAAAAGAAAATGGDGGGGGAGGVAGVPSVAAVEAAVAAAAVAKLAAVEAAAKKHAAAVREVLDVAKLGPVQHVKPLHATHAPPHPSHPATRPHQTQQLAHCQQLVAIPPCCMDGALALLLQLHHVWCSALRTARAASGEGFSPAVEPLLATCWQHCERHLQQLRQQGQAGQGQAGRAGQGHSAPGGQHPDPIRVGEALIKVLDQLAAEAQRWEQDAEARQREAEERRVRLEEEEREMRQREEEAERCRRDAEQRERLAREEEARRLLEQQLEIERQARQRLQQEELERQQRQRQQQEELMQRLRQQQLERQQQEELMQRLRQQQLETQLQATLHTEAAVAPGHLLGAIHAPLVHALQPAQHLQQLLQPAQHTQQLLQQVQHTQQLLQPAQHGLAMPGLPEAQAVQLAGDVEQQRLLLLQVLQQAPPHIRDAFVRHLQQQQPRS